MTDHSLTSSLNLLLFLKLPEEGYRCFGQLPPSSKRPAHGKLNHLPGTCTVPVQYSPLLSVRPSSPCNLVPVLVQLLGVVSLVLGLDWSEEA